MLKFKLLSTLFLVGLTTCAFALDSIPGSESASLTPCQKIVIAGDSQWPPYVISLTNPELQGKNTVVDVSGISMELLQEIFSELDIPVQEVTYDDQLHMLQALRNAEIDLIVATYWYDELVDLTEMFQPAYINDPVTVAVSKRILHTIKDWNDLVGLRGVMAKTFMVDDTTNAYFTNYLSITNQGTLAEALNAVVAGKYDYIVGSQLQLKYGLNNFDLLDQLDIVQTVNKGGQVYVAYNKLSACQPFALYVNKRLQDYKNNGKLDALIKKYTH